MVSVWMYGLWCHGQDFQTVPLLSDGPSDDSFQLTPLPSLVPHSLVHCAPAPVAYPSIHHCRMDACSYTTSADIKVFRHRTTPRNICSQYF